MTAAPLALAEDLFGVHVVTTVTEIPPGTARVHTSASGTIMLIESLYKPDMRPLWCVKCGRVTVHRTRNKVAYCFRCEANKKG